MPPCQCMTCNQAHKSRTADSNHQMSRTAERASGCSAVSRHGEKVKSAFAKPSTCDRLVFAWNSDRVGLLIAVSEKRGPWMLVFCDFCAKKRTAENGLSVQVQPRSRENLQTASVTVEPAVTAAVPRRHRPVCGDSGNLAGTASPPSVNPRIRDADEYARTTGPCPCSGKSSSFLGWLFVIR